MTHYRHLLLLGTLTLLQGCDSRIRSPEVPAYEASLIRSLPFQFDAVSAVLVLAPGQILIADALHPSISHVSVLLETSTGLGRAGDGPGEYRAPAVVVRSSTGNSYVWDSQLRRLLLIDTIPAVANTVPVPAELELATLLGESQGWLVFGRAVVGTEGLVDSMDVILWEIGTKITSTLTRISSPPTSAIVQVRGRVRRIRNVTLPFSSGDEVVVLGDGSLAIVRAYPYGLEILNREGKRTEYHLVEYRPIVVTTEERLQQLRSKDSLPVPEIKGPTVPGSALDGGNGFVWVGRFTAKSDSASVYDVLNEREGLVMQVRFPPRRRIVAVDQDVAYALTNDTDGFARIEQYRFK